MAEEKKDEKKELTPQGRSTACQKEVQQSLEKYKCGLVARPSFRFRDDGSWSLVTSVEIVANNGE